MYVYVCMHLCKPISVYVECIPQELLARFGSKSSLQFIWLVDNSLAFETVSTHSSSKVSHCVVGNKTGIAQC